MSQPQVAVIGTVFIDCKGFARGAYNPIGRNLGKIEFVHGGVARNVAETLAQLDLPVSFVSTVDDNGIGQEVIDRLGQNNIQTRWMRQCPANGMGMWLAILEQSGDLAGSISQMPDLAELTQLLKTHGAEAVEQSSHVVLEMDLNAEIAGMALDLAKRYGKPVYGLPGNLDVVLNHRHLLPRLSGFICNDIEAGRLMGRDLETVTPEDMLQLLPDYVRTEGLQTLVVTMGARGSVFCDARSGVAGFQPVFPVNLVDTTGAGDAFFSGTVMGLIRGLPLKDAVVCGTKVAGWTIESTENTCRDLRQRIRQDEAFQNSILLRA